MHTAVVSKIMLQFLEPLAADAMSRGALAFAGLAAIAVAAAASWGPFASEGVAWVLWAGGADTRADLPSPRCCCRWCGCCVWGACGA